MLFFAEIMRVLFFLPVLLSSFCLTSCSQLMTVVPPSGGSLAKAIDAEKGSKFETLKTVYISPPIEGDGNSISYLVYRKPSRDEYRPVPVGSSFKVTKTKSWGSYNNGYFPVIYGEVKTSDGKVFRNVNFTALPEHRHSRLNNRYYGLKYEGAYIKKL